MLNTIFFEEIQLTSDPTCSKDNNLAKKIFFFFFFLNFWRQTCLASLPPYNAYCVC